MRGQYAHYLPFTLDLWVKVSPWEGRGQLVARQFLPVWGRLGGGGLVVMERGEQV